jgi:hypothetical protein
LTKRSGAVVIDFNGDCSEQLVIGPSGVSRFKICMFELGSGSLRPEEQNRIQVALETEAGRLSALAAQFGVHGLDSVENP